MTDETTETRATGGASSREAGGRVPLLLARAGGLLVGLPLGAVVETMRALPCAPVPGAPELVLGAAVIRGAVTPVVSLARLLGREAGGQARLITVRAGARTVALAADEVRGVHALDAAEVTRLPRLLEPAPGVVASLGVLDHDLLLVLEAGRLLDDALLAALEGAT